MIVNEVENQALDRLDLDGCSPGMWTINHETPLVFTISVEAEEESEVGNTIGLVQTLKESTRKAFYRAEVEGEEPADGELSILPTVPLPCLDGKSETVPWYDENCGPRDLGPVGESVTLTLRDQPDHTVPGRASYNDSAIIHSIVRVQVEEKFDVSLYNVTTGQVVKQWSWEYNYEVRKGDRGGEMIVDEHRGNEGIEAMNTDIPLEGPVAGESQEKTWSQDWKNDEF